jgi:hypothetical protein
MTQETTDDLLTVARDIRAALTILAAIMLNAHPIPDRDEHAWVDQALSDLAEVVI